MTMTTAHHAVPVRRILMTRAKDDCARYADQLHPLGTRVSFFDPFETQPRPLQADVRAELLAACRDDHTAWAITSARAIAGLAGSDGELLAALRQRSFYAVGEGTAAALRSAGFHHVHAADGDIAALARMIALTASTHDMTRIIHLAGSVTAANLADLLAQTPLQVSSHVVYHAALQALPEDLRADLISGEIGAVVLLSARVAEHIAASLRNDALHLPRLYCLSSRIATAAQRAFAPHAPEIIVPPRPGIAALLTMIDAPAGGLHNIST